MQNKRKFQECNDPETTLSDDEEIKEPVTKQMKCKVLKPKLVVYPNAFLDRIYDDIIHALEAVYARLTRDVVRIMVSFLDPLERMKRQNIRGYVKHHLPHMLDPDHLKECCNNIVKCQDGFNEYWVTDSVFNNSNDDYFCFFCERYLFHDMPDCDMIEHIGACYGFVCPECVYQLPGFKNVDWEDLEEDFCPMCMYGTRTIDEMCQLWKFQRENGLELTLG